MKNLKAFFLGMYEFRRSFTQGHKSYSLRESYDKGRDLAHALTLRRYEDIA